MDKETHLNDDGIEVDKYGNPTDGDSLLFPTLAFGVLMPHIVLAQFVAKVAGGAIWAYLFKPKQAANADIGLPMADLMKLVLAIEAAMAATPE